MAERMWGDGLQFGANDDGPLAAAVMKSRRWRDGEQRLRAANNTTWRKAA